MPGAEQLPRTLEMMQAYSQEHYGAKLQIETVFSSDFQVGCEFCNFEGTLFYPHSVAQSRDELVRVIRILRENPFLLRLYTGPSMLALLRKCQQLGLQNLPSL
jgi:hypothetical protein